MRLKRQFYTLHGVEEYYEYDPDSGTLEVWQRSGDFFRLMPVEGEWRSPRLNVTLKVEADGTLGVYGPDGRKFEKPKDALNRADAEVTQAQAEAADAKAEAAAARATAECLIAKLRELGIDPE